MLFLKQLLTAAGVVLLATTAAWIFYELYLFTEPWRKRRRLSLDQPAEEPEPRPFRWRPPARLAAYAVAPLLAAQCISIVPAGFAGVRVSQLSGAKPGTLYPGVHWITPLIDSVALYDTRDHVFSTAAADDSKKGVETLKVQTREGLIVGLAVAVRYRLEPKKLDYIHSNLTQPLGETLVTPVVASAFREVAPAFLVRELFSTRREEVLRIAADRIAKKLLADGIVVREVMIRDLALPPEYAKGLEGLLLKQQENERLTFEVEIKQKLVRTAELEAEAEKARQVKRAEGDAQTVVLRAKAEADAMQYTLPLKEKQIEQTRLEAEARKASTIKNAEAMAAAKVIDSKAEFEKGKLMADGDANRIRQLASADAERMKTEAAALRDNPLLIQKIVAERMSDKVQLMMVPSDAKVFFNDVLKGGPVTTAAITSGK
jgi:regulator of protease activity HflC (stomatin/prohibitin superfamily)